MVNANSIFGGMLTTLGAAKKTNCDALGVPWEPRYMLIGDANGTDPVPNPAQTQLVHQVYRAQINQLYVSPTDANILIAELVLPPDVGGWWIRELALEDKDGVFCAVANAAPSYKPLLTQGSGRNQVVRMHIITSGTANIQLKIDPSVVLATRQYVDSSINGLLPANKTAGTYTRVTVNDRGVFVSGLNPTTLAGMGITDTYTKAEIEAMIAQASALPVGTQVSFPVNSIPPGFLERDGSVKSIALYPDLAAYLGGAFNRGDEGVGNFRLPESRGEGERGWDHGRGIDAGRAVGSYQLDALQNITGSYSPFNSTSLGQAHSGAFQGTGSYSYPAPSGNLSNGVQYVSFDASRVARTSTETRGRNVAVVMCIKAWNAPINQGNIDVAELAASVAKLARNGPVAGSFSGLKISTTGLSAAVSVSAAQLILARVDGEAYRASNVALSINCSAIGVNGLDTGVVAASTWYAVWVVSDGVNVSGLLSLSAIAPSLPAGYTHKARVGWIRTDATANKYPLSTLQCGNRAQYIMTGGNVSNLPILAAGAGGNILTPVYVAVATGAFVPPTASVINLSLTSGGGTPNSAMAAPNARYGGLNSLSNPAPLAAGLGSGTNARVTVFGELVLESNSVYYVSDTAQGVLFVIGWVDNL